MPEYLYEIMLSKYGIPKLTEKKLKEICLCLELNKKKNGLIDLFSRFMGIHNVYYTNDDLNFYYILNNFIYSQESIQ